MSTNSTLALNTALCANSAGTRFLQQSIDLMIPEIEAVERGAIVTTQLQHILGLETLPNLGELKSEPYSAVLAQPFEVPLIHHFMNDEKSTHPGLYQNPQHESLFDGRHPLNRQVPIFLRDARPMRCEDQTVGYGVICAGGAEADIEAYRLADGSRIAASTNRGWRDANADGFYFAHYLMGGQLIKVLVGTDGIGSKYQSEVAASALLQGIHAAVLEALENDQIPDPFTLFEMGQRAMNVQRDLHSLSMKSNATLCLAVIAGNDAYIASAGDSTLTWSRKTPDGYQTLGYTQVDCWKNTSTIFASASSRSAKMYHVSGLQADDRIVIGSDGLWGNILGAAYKIRGSKLLRSTDANDINSRAPDQRLFGNLNHMLDCTDGLLLSAQHFLQLASRSSSVFDLFRLNEGLYQLDLATDWDNLMALDYQHGTVSAWETSIPRFPTDKPLESVG